MGGHNGTWWGGGAYTLGGSPSPHVGGAGRHFLGQNRQSGPVADLGVWEGRNLPPLLSLAAPVIGYDTPDAKPAVSAARVRFPAVEFREGSFWALPFQDQELGGALCWRVLHNLTAKWELVVALREINRALQPDAPLLVAVRSEERADARDAPRIYERRSDNGAGLERVDLYFTPSALRLLAWTLGFQTRGIRECVEGYERINGQEIKHPYLVAELIKIGCPDPTRLCQAERLIARNGF